MAHQEFSTGDEVLEDLYNEMLSMNTEHHQYPLLLNEFSNDLTQGSENNGFPVNDQVIAPTSNPGTFHVGDYESSQALWGSNGHHNEDTSYAHNDQSANSSPVYPPDLSSDWVVPAQERGPSTDTHTRSRGLTESYLTLLQYQSPCIRSWTQESYAVGQRGQDQEVPSLSQSQDVDRLAVPEQGLHGRSTIKGHVGTPLRLLIPSVEPAGSSIHVRPASEAGTASTGLHRCQHHDCDLVFDTPSKLAHHSRYHTPHERRKHACTSCDRRFIHGKDLRRHLLTHDPNLGPTFFCPFSPCSKSYRRKDHLSRHVKGKHLNTSTSISPVSTRSPVPDAGTDWEIL